MVKPTVRFDLSERSASPNSDSAVAHLLSKGDGEVRIKEVHLEQNGFPKTKSLVSRLASGRNGKRARPGGSRIRRRRNWCLWTIVVVTAITILNFAMIFFAHNDAFVRTWTSIAPYGILQPGHDDELAVLTRGVHPIDCHSHNDYDRRVPLFEALHYGIASVEADVWALDEELYVGHTSAQLTPDRTFRSLYVNSLMRLLDLMNPTAANPPNGVFYEEPAQSLVLLVDFKTEGPKTLPLVEAQLQPLREKRYLSFFDGRTVKSGPITVVATGNAPFDLLIANSTYRDIFFDAPLQRIWEDASLETSPDDHTSNVRRGQGEGGTQDISSASVFTPENSYYASVDFEWSVGAPRLYLSDSQRAQMREQVEAAHAQGLKVRYWNFPGWPVGFRNYLWREMRAIGVDVLNVDDLKAAAGKEWKKKGQGWWTIWCT